MSTDELPEVSNGGEEQPTPEQLLLRMAVDKMLMVKQRRVWEMWNYDRMTQEEIAKKLHVTQASVSRQIATIEKQLTKWIRQHSEVYNTLKSVPSGSERT